MTRLVGGVWEPTTDVTGPGVALNPRIVTSDPTGAMTVLLTGSGGGGLWMVSRPSNGAWSAPEDVDVNPDWTLADISTNEQGDLVAAWSSAPDGAHFGGAHVARRPAGGSWTAPARVSRRAGYGISAALDRSGRATVVWTKYLRKSSPGTSVVQSVLLPALR